jgi:competence protein ComEA
MGQALAEEDMPPPGAELLPPGPGHDTAVRLCSTCHALEVVAAKRTDAAGWYETIDAMRARGAQISDAELTELTVYLAKAFPPEGSGGDR